MAFPISDVIVALMGAGGASGALALVNAVNKLRAGKLESEDRLINRLNEDNKKQNERADHAERQADNLRTQRNRAWTQATRFYTLLRSHNIDPGEDLVKFDGE